MLGRLMKYELKSTTILFVPLILILFGVSVVNRIFSIRAISSAINNLPDALSVTINLVVRGAFVVLVVAFMFISVYLLIQRFYKNLMGDQGYLMFTLPVSSWEHIASKTIIAIFWMTISTIAIVLSILMIIPESGIYGDFFRGLATIFSDISEILKFPIWVLVLETVVLWIIGFATFFLQVYAAITFGQRFNKSRKMGSFLSFFVLSVISNAFISFLTKIFGQVTGIEQNINNSITDFGFYQFVFARSFHTLILFQIVLSIIFAVGCFMLTKYNLEHKLNLE